MISINSIFTQKTQHCFKLSFAKMLVVSLVLGGAGCSAKHIEQTNVDDMLKSFAAGAIELGFVTNDYGEYRKKMRTFYAAKNWQSLAKAVIEGDLDTDTDWYYLGRSAEGLGFYKAAKIYYDNALGTGHKCNARVFKDDSGCEGFVFPQDVVVRLKVLRSYRPKVGKK